MSPTDAALETLRRVAHVSERRLLDERGRPTFGLSFYAVNKNGEFGAASMWSGRTHCAFDGREAKVRDSAYLFERN